MYYVLRNGLIKMNYDEVIKLIKVIDESSINTFEIDFEDTYISLNKLDTYAPKNSNLDNSVDFNGNINEVIKNVQIKEEQVNPVETKEIIEDTSNASVVKSPIVGTFYNSNSPDKPPFVKIGDSVVEGDTLCIVEAMKVMNEVKSKFNGTIKEILIENESVVEFGQPLFVISK